MEKSIQIFLPDKYKVIPRSLIFIIHNDEILLIKGAPDKKIWPNLYNGIGGHFERGESALSAAERELYEETGIQNVELRLKAIIMIDVEKDQGITLFVFMGETTNKIIKSSSEGKVEWLKIAELKNYPLVEDLYLLIPKLLEKKKGILFGRYYFDQKDDHLRMEFT